MRRLAITALVAAVIGGVPAAAATDRPLPTHDPFYSYDASKPLAKIPAGTVLKQRPVAVALAGAPSGPWTAEQLLYRTRDEHGKPTVTVTTVIEPDVTLPNHGMIAYLSFYDGFGPQCDPSYTLAGGYPGNQANQSEADEEELLIAHYLAAGATVTVPDFEGERHHWGAGQESGYASLDAITATESYLKLPASTRVALSGYSGGAIAADWASELVRTYRHWLNLVGAAEGGIPVDYAHNLDYVDGSATYSGTILGVLMAVGRAFPFNLHKHLSRHGRHLIAEVHDQCIGTFLGSHPGLRLRDVVKPRYRDLYQVRSFVRPLNHLIMGRHRGHPRAPLFMGVGNSDGTGDGVMLVGDMEALAHEYCKQGTSVMFSSYQGLGHEVAGAEFEPTATSFLLDRLAATPFQGNCASIGKGNSLAPLPVPKHH